MFGLRDSNSIVSVKVYFNHNFSVPLSLDVFSVLDASHFRMVSIHIKLFSQHTVPVNGRSATNGLLAWAPTLASWWVRVCVDAPPAWWRSWRISNSTSWKWRVFWGERMKQKVGKMLHANGSFQMETDGTSGSQRKTHVFLALAWWMVLGPKWHLEMQLLAVICAYQGLFLCQS